MEHDTKLISSDRLYIDDGLLESSNIQAVGNIDYLSMTVAELKSVAENKGIEVKSLQEGEV